MLAPAAWSAVILGGLLAATSVRAAESAEPAEFPMVPVESTPAAAEPTPVPDLPARTGRGALIAGGLLLGLGAAGRLGIEGFWAGPARLEPGEPFGQWSIPNIVLFTAFSNVLLVPGLVATGVGAYQRGRWREALHPGARPARARRNWRLGWGLLGSGLALWAVTRAAGRPVLRACSTNGCAYGYLESTFWLSLGAAVPGIVLVGLGAGERRAARDRRVGSGLSLVPVLGPRTAGLALGGAF